MQDFWIEIAKATLGTLIGQLVFYYIVRWITKKSDHIGHS
jgi:membrane protein DedA with SNARE-associated domain